MIATVVFFAERPVLKGMLMGDLWTAVVHKRAREIFTGARAWLKGMKLVGGIQHRVKEGV